MSENLANDMVRFRAKKRIGQKELADMCGLSVQTICSIETEKQTPTKITEAKIRLVIDAEETENREE